MRFAVRRPGTPEASPRSHGVPRRDVDCRVHVSVAGEAAGGAAEKGLAPAAFRCDVPARRAALARERGWYSLDPAGCLVLQAADQQAPARTADPPVQPGLLPRVVRPCLGELSAALGEPRRRPASRTPPRLLLDAQVPHVPGVGAVPQQDCFLLAGRLKAVPRHTNILAKNTFLGQLMCRTLIRVAGRRIPPRVEDWGIFRRSW